MEQIRRLYLEALATNREAFAHSLFKEAGQSLSTALHCAFDLQDREELAQVERLARQQMCALEEQLTSQLSPLESPELGDYRALAELATTYRTLVQTGEVVQSHVLDGHKFEEITTLDARSETARPLYTIDDIDCEPGTWDTKYQAAQEHEKAAHHHTEEPE